MSSEELDKLFKDKLEGIRPEPSSKSWRTIQARIEEKKGVWFYVRIAAVILLLISFTALYVFNTKPTEVPSKTIAGNITAQPIPQVDTVKNDTTHMEEGKTILKPIQEKVAIVDSSRLKSKESKRDAIPKAVHNKDNLATNENAPSNEPPSIKMDSVIQQIDNQDLKTDETLVAENNKTDATSEIEEASSLQDESESGSTLVFNIEDFDMKSAVTSAYQVAEETKKSGFKKVMDFVKNVKEGEAGLGGLREAKNNLLSIKQKEKGDDNSK